jgi:hypothetical protein
MNKEDTMDASDCEDVSCLEEVMVLTQPTVKALAALILVALLA